MKRSLHVVLAAALILVVSNLAFAQSAGFDLAGTWAGSLELPGSELGMVFHVSQDENGVWQGTLDVPAQGAFGIPVSQVTVEDGTVVFDVSLIAGVYSGSFNLVTQAIDGIWAQSGMQIPLVLEKSVEVSAGPARPQEPQPPYPYREIEVRYPNEVDGIELAGTLTLPEGDGPFPVALLISGSGPQDRNEEIMGHKPFLVLADYLTRRGVAVLRFDDRGVGESGGDFASATTLDFTRDVLAGVEYLKTRPEIDPNRIGLIGHSEGGLIAPLAASQSSDVAFIVLMAAPGTTGEEITMQQVELLLKASNVPDSVIAQQLEMQAAIFDIVRDVQDVEQTVEELKSILLAPYATLSEEEKAALGDVETQVMLEISQLLSPWYQFFMTYDPQPTLRQVTCPVLAINGSKDVQVPADPNLKLIEQALKEAGNENVTIVELPDLNHLFQTAQTGLPDEYYSIEETMSPVALEVMGDWLVEITGIN